MSANRDRNQRVTFVYSNFYQLYKNGKEAAVSSNAVSIKPSSAVLKAGDRNSAAQSTVQNYQPVTLMAKKTKPATPLALATAPVAQPKVQNSAVDSLKENLKTLNDLHARLNFMLKELEELVQE